MSSTDDIAEALSAAKRRLRYAEDELSRHRLIGEPDDHYAAQRYQHTDRKLADDVALARNDIATLSRELTRLAQSDAQAL
jgi:hypothetical protein